MKDSKRCLYGLVWASVLFGQVGAALGFLSAKEPEYREEYKYRLTVKYSNDDSETVGAHMGVFLFCRRKAFMREMGKCVPVSEF